MLTSTTTMAGASAADVRSILSLPSSLTPAPSQPKKATTPLSRKPSGISRELYSLIGPSAPTLVAQVAKPRLKQKPNLGSGASSKWYVSSGHPLAKKKYSSRKMVQGVEAFQEFCKGGWAGARSLGQSQHGPRCRSVHLFSPCYHFDIKAALEYPFARYNVKFPDCTYSQEEYTQLMEGSRA